jgi:hypothetical protein
MNNNYEKKYLKYKEKYLKLKNQSGSGSPRPEMSEGDFEKLLVRARYGSIDWTILEQEPGLVRRMGGPSSRMLIHEACLGGRLENVKGLLARGSPVDPYERGIYSCVYYAASYNHLAIVDLLLDNSADPCGRGLNYTALGRAAQKGYLEMCILLLSRGADLTALMRYRQPESLTALERYGEETNMNEEQKEEGRLAMIKAWEHGPHPIQQAIRWNRRWPFMSVMTGCRFRPLPGRQGLIPPEGLSLEQRERSRRRSLVFSSDVLLRIIVSFL